METYFFHHTFVVVVLLLDNGFGGTPSEFEEIFVLSSCWMKIFDSTCQ